MRSAINKTLTLYFKELRLPAFQESFSAQAQLARQESISYEEYLLNLAEREHESRRENRIKRYLKASGIPLEKSLDTFDRKRLSQKVNAQLNSLLEDHS